MTWWSVASSRLNTWRSSFSMKPMRCFHAVLKLKFRTSLSSCLVRSRLPFSQLLSPTKFLLWPSTLWETQQKFSSRIKNLPLKVFTNITSQSKKKSGKSTYFLIFTLTWISTKLWSIATLRKRSRNLKRQWLKMSSPSQLCTEKWTN